MDAPSGSGRARVSARVEPAADGAAWPEHAETDLSAVLAAAARGDESAWRVVIARYSRRVFALAKSRVRSPELAEEVAQSVFATVASKLGSGGYTEQGRFESWLFRVVMNRVRDEARRVQRHATPTDPALLPVVADARADSSGLDPGALARLRAAMDGLSDQDREVVELRHHGQMSFKAMAELLDEPLGTLLARHHRALRKLHTLISGVSVAGDSIDPPRSVGTGSGPVPSSPLASGSGTSGSGPSKGGRRHEP